MGIKAYKIKHYCLLIKLLSEGGVLLKVLPFQTFTQTFMRVNQIYNLVYRSVYTIEIAGYSILGSFSLYFGDYDSDQMIKLLIKKCAKINKTRVRRNYESAF